MPPEGDNSELPFGTEDAQGAAFDDEVIEAKPLSPHAGHRERLKHRFLEAGEKSLADHEMLEMLLFSAYPRGDTKPYAKRLIERFGSYEEVLAAPLEQLREFFPKNNSAVAILKVVEAAAIRLAARQVLKKPIIASWSALLSYCQANIARSPIEQFRVLMLDTKNRLIEDRLMGEGTVDHAPVYPREIVKRVSTINAKSVVLVHNHPSGDPTPSQADIDMTRKIVTILKEIGVSVHDHVVFGRTGHFSFMQQRLM